LLYLENGFMKFKLADNNNLTYYTTPCNITRVDPALEPADLDFLTQLFNANDGNNIKKLIVAEAMKNYQTDLNASLYDERFPLNNHSEYTWNDTVHKRSITISYTMLPTGSHIKPNGLSLNFVTEITDDDYWKCGATVPS
jgi:D-ribose pyranose/furanose isomerase RbsD